MSPFTEKTQGKNSKLIIPEHFHGERQTPQTEKGLLFLFSLDFIVFSQDQIWQWPDLN